MPLVPMPGSVPRGWSFRQTTSNRTLGQKSTTNESRLGDETRAMSYEMESVAELPSESDEYDTPYREDCQGVTETKVRPKSNPERQKSNRRATSEPPVYDLPSDEDESQATLDEETINTKSHHKPFVSDQPSIALFGATGITGGHFLTAALDAGYHVRCMPADDPRETGSHAEWSSIKHGLEDVEQLRVVVYRVDYVVIMLNDVMPGKNEYPAGFLASFVERLYTVLRDEHTVQVVLFQATSLAVDVKGKIPFMSKVIKTVAQRRNTFLQDQDAAIHRIGVEHGVREYNDENRSVNLAPPHFRFIITRPSVLLQDGPSSKKLAASKSQPGPFPVTHIDLADFSLSALSMERMYDSSPYVVADSF